MKISLEGTKQINPNLTEYDTDKIYLMEVNTGAVDTEENWESEKCTWQTDIDREDYTSDDNYSSDLEEAQQEQFDKLVHVRFDVESECWIEANQIEVKQKENSMLMTKEFEEAHAELIESMHTALINLNNLIGNMFINNVGLVANSDEYAVVERDTLIDAQKSLEQIMDKCNWEVK